MKAGRMVNICMAPLAETFDGTEFELLARRPPIMG